MLYENLSAIGYGFAGIAFLTLTVLLVSSWQGRLQGAVLIAAAAFSALWGLALTVSFSHPGLDVVRTFLAEILRSGSWLAFLSVLFAGGMGSRSDHRILVFGGPVLAVLVLLSGLALTIPKIYEFSVAGVGAVLTLGSMVLSLFALIMLEQIYRNARPGQRSSLKFFCLGLAVVFLYDLVLYSHWILFRQADPLFWSVRGFIAALSVPLIAVSAQRNPGWTVGIFVSRQVVFYTTTVMAVGTYLVAIAAVGFYIRHLGGSLGPAAQLVFFAAALLSLAVMLASERLRVRLRVFLSKHFFRNRYDYREEWLRLMNTLASPEDPSLTLDKRSIKALADILRSPRGVLYLYNQDAASYRCAAGWNTGVSDKHLPADGELANFLQSTKWIVDVPEYQGHPEKYPGVTDQQAFGSELEALGIPSPGFIVPLVMGENVLGFIILSRPAPGRHLNFEDHDLLKTVGRQVASYLDQEIKKFQLAEVRQFETFNRLTAFLMHDLKNLIAQQTLMVENAERHIDNPKFVEDAIDTVRAGVARMHKILEQLSKGAPAQALDNVELGRIVLEAAAQCADRDPRPTTEIAEARVWVKANREQLLMAFIHAIRNAQDATPPGGNVTVSLETADAKYVVRIRDTGRGMEQSFIEQRLFKPFDSTKGSHGMGIGAYQIRETVRSIGGQLLVDSKRGVGTCVTILLPPGSRAVTASRDIRAVAVAGGV
jgi:putative PEP-CTERM system histidine kinase